MLLLVAESLIKLAKYLTNNVFEYYKKKKKRFKYKLYLKRNRPLWLNVEPIYWKPAELFAE